MSVEQNSPRELTIGKTVVLFSIVNDALKWIALFDRWLLRDGIRVVVWNTCIFCKCWLDSGDGRGFSACRSFGYRAWAKSTKNNVVIGIIGEIAI